MPRTIQQTITLPVSPAVLYRTYLSARRHTAACGWGRASITPRVGGRMAQAPHIRGKFLHLDPGRLIVQTWRERGWKRSDPDSVLSLAFHPRPRGAQIVMVHTNVPDAHARSIARGWYTYYWRPWRAYLRTVM
jgi:uncharacterized protein YndB with AHSA1/START domain